LRGLRPSAKYSAIALIGFVVTSLSTYVVTPFLVTDTVALGFPIAFWASWGPCLPPEVCFEILWGRLTLDLVFWYGLALGFTRLNRRRPTSACT
jgi:hypothetical protein